MKEGKEEKNGKREKEKKREKELNEKSICGEMEEKRD